MKIRTALLILLLANVFTACTSQQKSAPVKSTADTVYTFRKASADGIGKFYFGREIAQVMGAAGSDWLERPDRNQEENTQLAIDSIVLPVDAVIADIGAGTGYYSFKLAAKVPAGKVFAVDVQDEMIRMLQEKKKALKNNIVEVIKGTEKSPDLPADTIDLALMVDVYHELEFPHEMLQAIKKSLKATGKILLLEYRGEDASVPIKPLHKTTVAQLNREMEANGFKLNRKGDFLPMQHFLLYEKK